MQKHRAAAASDARTGVVIDLDDEVIEVIGALQPIGVAVCGKADRSIVTAA